MLPARLLARLRPRPSDLRKRPCVGACCETPTCTAIRRTLTNTRVRRGGGRCACLRHRANPLPRAVTLSEPLVCTNPALARLLRCHVPGNATGTKSPSIAPASVRKCARPDRAAAALFRLRDDYCSLTAIFAFVAERATDGGQKTSLRSPDQDCGGSCHLVVPRVKNAAAPPIGRKAPVCTGPPRCQTSVLPDGPRPRRTAPRLTPTGRPSCGPHVPAGRPALGSSCQSACA